MLFQAQPTMTRIATASHRDGIAHRTSGLGVLFEQLVRGRKYFILDLGPALGINIDFWSQISCKIYIQDFYRSLRAPGVFPPEEGVSCESVFDKFLPAEPDVYVDIILCWDLLNYFKPSEIEGLARCLSRYCQRGTLLFALVSSLPQIPAEPITFRILDRTQLIYEIHTQAVIPAPRYLVRDIIRLMSGFQVLGSFLLRNGFQEHLLSYR